MSGAPRDEAESAAVEAMLGFDGNVGPAEEDDDEAEQTLVSMAAAGENGAGTVVSTGPSGISKPQGRLACRADQETLPAHAPPLSSSRLTRVLPCRPRRLRRRRPCPSRRRVATIAAWAC